MPTERGSRDAARHQHCRAPTEQGMRYIRLIAVLGCGLGKGIRVVLLRIAGNTRHIGIRHLLRVVRAEAK